MKNIKVNETFSEETTMFRANLYVNGKKVGECENDGHGGSTFIHQVSKGSLDEVTEFCKNLPPRTYSSGGEYPMDLECMVDDLLNDFLIQKDEKKLIKNMLKGILYGSPNHYQMIGWKNMTLEHILTNPKGYLRVKELVKELKEKGKVILNTNLPEEILNQ